jgi:predicted FMN-binding regulatory protein PaiB
LSAIDRLLGKSQACQQYNAATRSGVINGLLAEQGARAAAMAEVIRDAAELRD